MYLNAVGRRNIPPSDRSVLGGGIPESLRVIRSEAV